MKDGVEAPGEYSRFHVTLLMLSWVGVQTGLDPSS